MESEGSYEVFSILATESVARKLLSAIKPLLDFFPF